jgi:plasmid stability protein
MQGGSKKGLYLHLHNHAMHQLRQAAKRHQWTAATEATRILEETLRPGRVRKNVAASLAGAEKCNANGLYLDLSEELLARLRPLAERDYRSVASEAAFVLETVLGIADSTILTAASRPKPKIKFRKKAASRPP